MKTANNKKRSIGSTTAPANNPVINLKTGGSGWVTPVVGGIALFSGFMYLKSYLADKSTRDAEGDTSPEAIIADRFVSVFGPRDDKKWFPDEAEYKTASLLLTDQNKKLVFEKYYNKTGRALSIDIAGMSTAAKEKADKIQSYNSKPGKLFSITAEGKIKFEIVKGDKIRFTPGQTTPVTAYFSYFGPILNELVKAPGGGKELIEKLRKDPKTAVGASSISIKPSAALYKVNAVKEVPYNSFQNAEGWTKYLRPFVNVSKTFAMIQISLGINPNTKKEVLVWIDGRDMITQKTNVVKGLSSTASLLI